MNPAEFEEVFVGCMLIMLGVGLTVANIIAIIFCIRDKIKGKEQDVDEQAANGASIVSCLLYLAAIYVYVHL